MEVINQLITGGPPGRPHMTIPFGMNSASYLVTIKLSTTEDWLSLCTFHHLVECVEFHTYIYIYIHIYIYTYTHCIYGIYDNTYMFHVKLGAMMIAIAHSWEGWGDDATTDLSRLLPRQPQFELQLMDSERLKWGSCWSGENMFFNPSKWRFIVDLCWRIQVG